MITNDCLHISWTWRWHDHICMCTNTRICKQVPRLWHRVSVYVPIFQPAHLWAPSCEELGVLHAARRRLLLPERASLWPFQVSAWKVCSMRMRFNLSVCLSVWQSVFCLSVCLSVFLRGWLTQESHEHEWVHVYARESHGLDCVHTCNI